MTDAAHLQGLVKETLIEFAKVDRRNILTDVAEVNLCARIGIILQRKADELGLQGYYADTEYNRKQEGKVKTMMGDDMRIVPIRCDLLLHSRGEHVSDDNLIAIEAKKSSHPKELIESHRLRLRILTHESFGDNTWSADGIAHPEHVCGYKLGCLIVFDASKPSIAVESFVDGEQVDHYTIDMS